MGIDPFILVAQIVNFIILILLLQRFLYGPIMRVMNQRKQKIKASLDEAAEKIIEAEKEAEKYRNLQQELVAKQEQILSEAQVAAERERVALLKQARAEVDASQSLWYEALQRERELFVQDLYRRTGQQIYQVLCRTLADLANQDLETQIIDVFIQKLQGIDLAKKEAFGNALPQSKQKIYVRSAFAIPTAKQVQITQVIQSYFTPEAQIIFNVDPDLLCGIQLTAAGQEIAWNLTSYLQNLEENLTVALELNQTNHDRERLQPTARSS